MPGLQQRAPRRRLPPEERRRDILDSARTLFAERPYAEVSTADVALAAGVARSLVHHYFGGIRGVFLAVVAESANALTDARTAGVETPLDERLAHNIRASLDVVWANRETWLAVMARGADGANPEVRDIIEMATARSVQRAMAISHDVIDDTPEARLALRCFHVFSTEATHAWLDGRATREQVEALLITALRDLVTHTIPALSSSP